MNPETNTPPQQPTTPPAMPPEPAPLLPSTPDVWPGAFGAYKYSKEAMGINMNALALVVLLLIVVGILLSIIPDNALAGKIVTTVIEYTVSAASSVAFTLLLVAGVRRQRMPASDALRQSVPLTIKMLIMTILISMLLGASLLLLIVPFFFVLPRLALANYYLVDQKLGMFESIDASWKATKGYSGRIWGLIGAKFAMYLLVITIIGIPFSIYFVIMYSAVYAVLYEYILKHPPVDAAPATAAQPLAPQAPVPPAAPPAA